MAIVTTAEFTAYTGLTETAARLTAALSVAEARVARRLGVASLTRATYTDEPHTGRGTTRLALRTIGLDEGETLTIKVRGTGTVGVEVQSSAYRVTDARRGVVSLLGFHQGEVFDNNPFSPRYSEQVSGPGWTREPAGILVTMTGGYDTDANPAPEDLKQIVFVMMVDVLETTKPIGLSNQSEGGYSYGLASRTERAERLEELLRDWTRERGGVA